MILPRPVLPHRNRMTVNYVACVAEIAAFLCIAKFLKHNNHKL
jgi:hypothetical protein